MITTSLRMPYHASVSFATFDVTDSAYGFANGKVLLITGYLFDPIVIQCIAVH